MIYEKINLKDVYPNLPNDVVLTVMCHSNTNEYPGDLVRPAVIVLPGGGYAFCSSREAEPIAIRLMANNINCFVLNYSTAEFKYPLPFVEVVAALDYVSNNADRYRVDSNKIGVMGFSAGGHLAACISEFYDDPDFIDLLHVNPKNVRPSFCVLGYPVTDLKDPRENSCTTHNITQDRDDLLNKFNIYEKVSKRYPPTFIWTTKTDSVVPYRQSVILKNKLDELGVLCEFHLYEKGEHGGATCDDLTNPEEECKILGPAKEWISLASNFIKYKI